MASTTHIKEEAYELLKKYRSLNRLIADFGHASAEIRDVVKLIVGRLEQVATTENAQYYETSVDRAEAAWYTHELQQAVADTFNPTINKLQTLHQFYARIDQLGRFFIDFAHEPLTLAESDIAFDVLDHNAQNVVDQIDRALVTGYQKTIDHDTVAVATKFLRHRIENLRVAIEDMQADEGDKRRLVPLEEVRQQFPHESWERWPKRRVERPTGPYSVPPSAARSSGQPDTSNDEAIAQHAQRAARREEEPSRVAGITGGPAQGRYRNGLGLTQANLQDQLARFRLAGDWSRIWESAAGAGPATGASQQLLDTSHDEAIAREMQKREDENLAIQLAQRAEETEDEAQGGKDDEGYTSEADMDTEKLIRALRPPSSHGVREESQLDQRIRRMQEAADRGETQIMDEAVPVSGAAAQDGEDISSDLQYSGEEEEATGTGGVAEDPDGDVNMEDEDATAADNRAAAEVDTIFRDEEEQQPTPGPQMTLPEAMREMSRQRRRQGAGRRMYEALDEMKGGKRNRRRE